ncbi:hypothetical protein VTK73DRAFT_4241 [Phialemonium thermophilum]|uniref:Uncharacterized protein n=1 Tax=Phialemonium thermophilum TaxID=223376 RepID=A0ABR3VAP3_9PEZI
MENSTLSPLNQPLNRLSRHHPRHRAGQPARRRQITPGEGDVVRFTQTPSAFYITTLAAPNATLDIASPVPYQHGDRVTVVGGSKSGAVVPSQLLRNGTLRLQVSEEIQKADQYAWVFKIALDR